MGKIKALNYFKVIKCFNIFHITNIKYILRKSIFKSFDSSTTVDMLLNLSLKFIKNKNTFHILNYIDSKGKNIPKSFLGRSYIFKGYLNFKKGFGLKYLFI